MNKVSKTKLTPDEEEEWGEKDLPELIPDEIPLPEEVPEEVPA